MSVYSRSQTPPKTFNIHSCLHYETAFLLQHQNRDWRSLNFYQNLSNLHCVLYGNCSYSKIASSFRKEEKKQTKTRTETPQAKMNKTMVTKKEKSCYNLLLSPFDRTFHHRQCRRLPPLRTEYDDCHWIPSPLHGTLAPPASSSSSQHPIPNAAVAYELFSSVSVHPRCCRSSFPRSFLLALLVLLGAAVGVAASVLIVIGHPELVSLSSLSSPLSRARVKPLSSIPWLSELTFLPPSPSLLFLPCHRKQSYFNLCFLILLFYPRPSKLLSLSSEGRFEASVIVIVESYLTGSVPTTLPSTTALPSAPLKPNPNTRITLSSLHSPGFSRSHQRLTTLCRRRIPSQSRPHPAHNALLHFVLRHSFPSTVVVSIQRLRCLSGFSPAISVVSPSSISLSPIGFFCQKLCSVAASATGCVAGGPVDVLVAVGVITFNYEFLLTASGASNHIGVSTLVAYSISEKQQEEIEENMAKQMLLGISWAYSRKMLILGYMTNIVCSCFSGTRKGNDKDFVTSLPNIMFGERGSHGININKCCIWNLLLFCIDKCRMFGEMASHSFNINKYSILN
ncbi:hypothetical protein Ahy_A08g040461 isoform B [Arachis hypogaea]|uniref:Uncharacterized protein n=1 Tax=Arachis hypogaea TaxID=3818 RepID=A0A445BZA9_ARAHY|nr:hypothetical protein Ahy_A08g040461 isoform B [Arachis hypogaea]